MRRLALLLTGVVAMSAIATQPLGAQDISGKWVLSVELGDLGGGDPSFVFKQEGTKLTGTYSGALGEAEITGTVEGNKFEFSFGSDEAGTVTYEGTIDGDTMKGTCVYGDFADGTFTGKRSAS